MKKIRCLSCQILCAAALLTLPAVRPAAAEAVPAPTRDPGTPLTAPEVGSDTVVGYSEYLRRVSARPDEASEFVLYGREAQISGSARISDRYLDSAGQPTLETEPGSSATWRFRVPSAGLYAVECTYRTVPGSGAAAERALYINGRLPFTEAEFLTLPRFFADETEGAFAKDARGNEIKPAQKEICDRYALLLRDPYGYAKAPLRFYLEKGENTLTLEAVKEPLMIESLRFFRYEEPPTYGDYLRTSRETGATEADESLPVIPAERPVLKSEPSLLPLADRSSRYSEPQSAAVSLLNTVGGDKWQLPGQTLIWETQVPEDGLYRIGLRARQNILSGAVSARRLTIDGEVPFREANNLLFPFSSDFKRFCLGDDENGEYLFYLKKGKRRIGLEVVLADETAAILEQTERNLARLNEIYRNIFMITGAVPDLERDYDFARTLPEEIAAMGEIAEDLGRASRALAAFSGRRGEMSAVLEKLRFQLEIMAEKPKKIAANLDSFKSNLGALAAWLLTAKQQPLEIDAILPAGQNETYFDVKESKGREILFALETFVRSFFDDYDTSEARSERSLKVWLSAGRDQTQIIRGLCDSKFTPKSGVRVRLQLVAADALLPSVLAGIGPDAALSIACTEPVNFAVRGAVRDLSGFPDFAETAARFHESAMVPLSFDGKTYALPETHTFPMMFYRKDIFEELGLKPPETWDDFYRMIPVLRKNNLEIGFQANLSGLQIFLYQQNIALYRRNGAETNLDDNAALDAFKRLTELYTMYDFPVSYDFANRFRTGLMPLAIQDFTLYNQLTVFAPEIRGLWDFVPVPGTPGPDGEIDRSVPSGGTAAVILSKTRSPEDAWAFLKWWTDADTQGDFGRRLEALMGASAKYATANTEAFAGLSWSADVYKRITDQRQWARGTPEVPGSYSVGRYVEFAFGKVYNNRENPVETLLDYTDDINKELRRKRAEFGLAD